MGCCHDTGFARLLSSSSSKKKREQMRRHYSIGIHKSQFIPHRQVSIRLSYEIENILGEGSFGKVYLITDKRSQKQKAMKEIRVNTAKDAEYVWQEIEILKCLDHPNIMKVHELVETSSAYYVISEYLEGGELLDKLVSQSYFDEATAARYMTDIFNALSYLHSNQIVHRDLKPENILLESKRSDSRVKIIDFGISAILKPEKLLKESLGTVRSSQVLYIAPEVFTSEYNEKCDVWSAGVILYVLLTGRVPFFAEHEIDVEYAIRNSPVRFAKTDRISSAAKDLIKKLLTKNPKKRPSAQQIKTHKWFRMFEKRDNNNTKDYLTVKALENLRTFNSQKKIAKYVCHYIVYQSMYTKDNNQLTELFINLDKDRDGKISRYELEEAFLNYGLPVTNIEEIIDACDSDHSGFIYFTEFLMATQNWKNILERNYLEHVFSQFDAEACGELSLDVLKREIQGVSDDEWAGFLKEADKNKNGAICIQEFKDYLINKLSNPL